MPAASFFQVSAAGAGELAELVAELAAPVEDRRVLDLYGGVGLYATTLLRLGAREAVVCDADREAVTCGERLAVEQNLHRLRYVHSRVDRLLAGDHCRPAPDVVVANPPRSGLGSRVTEALRSLGPERIVVVSCDPPTLARDLRALVASPGYRLERVVPVDLFPQTAHVEAVASLSRG
jgi:tRNA/tmRNA/rRNA uracil-C5-methylase (TrmA/RlmC/RlmD family)